MSGAHSIVDVTPGGRVESIDVGNGVTMLRYPGEPLAPGSWRVRHRCDRGERGVIVCAPSLSPGHVVHSTTPLTITASILCPDCGLHGFVTEGAWR